MRKSLLDDLPRGFNTQNGANCADIHLGSCPKSRGDESGTRAQLREDLLADKAAAKERR